MIGLLRDNKIRTRSGLWLQIFYYVGIKEFIDEAHSDSKFDALENHWITASKNSEAAHLALSTVLISHAWFYRSGGYASTVSQDAGKKFQSKISEAKKFLLENESISK